MLVNFLLFFTGLFLLYLGAEFLVRGASKTALMARISPLIIGATVVAFGTSSPEIIVSFVAAFSGKPDVAIGNIVGSNIANVGLILGVSAFIRTVKLKTTKISSQVFWMLGASFLFLFFILNEELSQWEGIVFVIGLIMFIVQSIKTSLDHPNPEYISPDKINRFPKSVQILIYFVMVVLGIFILVWGSNITIDSAISIARYFGISEIIIGLTLVAFGTSLPELATAIISIIKKENAILIGNVIGSNLFNILCVGGLVSTFIPLPIQQRVINIDAPFMIFISLLLLPVVFRWNKISRIFGFVLLVLYCCYIMFSFYYLG